MALLTIHDLKNTLDTTRATLLSATDGDGIVSRDDFEQLTSQMEDPLERNFLQVFYHEFLLKLDDKSGVRVTESLIDRGIDFIQEQILSNLAIDRNPGLQTQQNMSLKHDLASQMALELIDMTTYKVILSPLEVSQQIEQIKAGLFFDDLGSEAGIEITPFFLEHPTQPLSPESFIQARGLDPTTPKAVVSRFLESGSAEKILYRFIDKHDAPLTDRARAVVEFMVENLTSFKVIVLGEANLGAYDSEHPVYVIGSGKDGNLAGFESMVVWT